MSAGISFSIKKKEGPLVSEKSDPLIKRQEDDRERKDFVLSLEGKEIHRYNKVPVLPLTYTNFHHQNTLEPSLIGMSASTRHGKL